MGEMTLGNEFETRMDFHMQWVDKFLRENKIGMKLNPPKEADLKAALAKAKGKKAQIYAVLDLPLLFIEIRVPGSKAFRVGAKDLDSLRDNDKVGDMLNQWSGSTKLVTGAEYYKWQETHMNKMQISFANGTLLEMRSSQEKLTAEQTAISNYVFPNKASPLDSQLHAFTATRSWEHYLKFVEDIDASKDAKTIFDTYVGDKATLPVNLAAPMKSKLKADIDAGKAPDFKPARELIVKLVNTKFVVEMTKDKKAANKKELDRLKTAIPEMEKKIKTGGG